jgi:hypothetical protein
MDPLITERERGFRGGFILRIRSVSGHRVGLITLRADSGDREQSVHSIMNTDSGDHEHPLALA